MSLVENPSRLVIFLSCAFLETFIRAWIGTLDMEKTKLGNKMNVIFHENPATEFTTLALNVKVGSDEETAHHGISHFTEHMMFEGTRKRTPFEIVNAIESVGGYINASTSEINTVYFASVPIGNEKILFDVIHDLVFDPVFKNESIIKERSIIMREYENSIDVPEGWLWLKTYESMLGKPSVIGSKRAIAGMNRAAILDFYNAWYVPNNMSVIITGRQPFFEEIDRCFSKHVAGKIPRRQKLVSTFPSRKMVSQQMGKDAVYVMHSVPVPGLDSDDSYVLALIRSILDRPMSGRLNVATRIRKGLVYGINCSNYSSREYGIFNVSYSTSNENLKECQNIVLREIKKAGEIDDVELRNSKNHIKGTFMRAKERMNALIEVLAFWDTIGDVSLFDKYVPRIMRINKAQVAKVMQKYLSGDVFTAIST